jgi:hypothetical protein
MIAEAMPVLPRARPMPVRLRAAGAPPGVGARRRSVCPQLRDGLRKPRFDPQAGPESEGGGRNISRGVTEFTSPPAQESVRR